MGRSAPDQRRDRFEEIATAAQVTVLPGPRGPSVWTRAAGARPFSNRTAIVCVVAVALAVLTAVAALGVFSRPAPRAPVGARPPAGAGVVQTLAPASLKGCRRLGAPAPTLCFKPHP